MTSPTLLAYRRANKPPEYVASPVCSAIAPFPVINWIIVQREVYWSHETDNWEAKQVGFTHGLDHQLTETEARAEAALLNGETP